MRFKKKIKQLILLKFPRLYKLIQLHYHYNLMNEINIDPTALITFPFYGSIVSIDKYSYLSKNCTIHGTSIGSFCSIGPNLMCGWGIHPTRTLSTHPMFYSTNKQNGTTLSSIDKVEEHKHITIGNDVFIGMNVVILDGVTIGDGAIIGAGSVVSKDIPPYAIAVGNPIQIIKYRFDSDKIQSLLKIKWWNFDLDELKKVEECFFDVDGFIANNKI